MAEPTAFLRGWTKLADELKLEIIRHALPANEIMSYIQFHPKHREDTVQTMSNMGGGREEVPKEWFLFDGEVLPLLACPPIALLAREAFYTQNTFTVGGNSSWFSMREGESFVGPLASKVRPHVRRTVLKLSPYARNIEAFAKIASWYPNLHECHIDFDCWHLLREEGRASFREFVTQMGPIELTTRKLVLQYRADPGYYKPSETGMSPHAELEELFMSKITIAVPEGKDRTESWERFTFEPMRYSIVLGKTIQHFEAWPVVLEDDGIGRMTRRTVQMGRLGEL